MSTSQRHTDLPAAKPRWRALYPCVIVTLGVATIYLTCRTAGSEAFEAAIVFGALVGAGFVVVAHRWLRWFSVAVFGAAIIGGIAGVELAVYDGSVSVNRWHDSGIPTLNTEINAAVRILGTHAALGAFVGGIFGAMLGGWLRAKSGAQVDESAHRWYLPSKGALIGLLVLASCVALIGALAAHDEQRHRDRLEALEAIEAIGGSVDFPIDKDRLRHDADEIDLRNSLLTDAELKYIIALNPQRRLRLGNGISYEGVKKLRQALPECKIERWSSSP